VPLKNLSVGDLIFVINAMLEDGRDILDSSPKLTPWTDDLEECLNNLKTAKAPDQTTPEDPDEVVEESPEGRLLDRRAEAAVRAISKLLELLEDLALAGGDDAQAARWFAIRQFVFSQGLAFLKAAWPDQTGQTLRFLTLTEDRNIAPKVAGLKVNDLTWADMIGLARTNNQSLIDHIKKAKDEATKELTLVQARRDALSLFKDLLPIIDRVLPPSSEDEKILSKRQTLLKSLEERLVSRSKSTASTEETEPPTDEVPEEPEATPSETPTVEATTPTPTDASPPSDSGPDEESPW
jgi:hypothetical protein